MIFISKGQLSLRLIPCILNQYPKLRIEGSKLKILLFI